MKKNTFQYLLLALVAMIFSTSCYKCFSVKDPYTQLAPGTWRATLKLDYAPRPLNEKAKPKPDSELQFEEVVEGELPFLMEVAYETDSIFTIEIINGEERIKVPYKDITTIHNLETNEDTIIIDFPHYDSYIKAIFEGEVMEGSWHVKTRDNYSIYFVAKQGIDYRFTTLRKMPQTDISGKWEVTFGTDTDAPYPAIGEFKQKGNELEGTFMTETGDFRYLEGTIQDNKIYLSTFDGSHAFLFEGKLTSDDEMIGYFRSGKHYRTIWEAKRNDNAKLVSPDSLTYIKEGYDKLAFSFFNSKNEKVSLEDEKYKGKAVIIQILGTWCPNCADETDFLVDYLNKNKDLDLEVIGLAFEKHRDSTQAFAAVERFKKRFDVPYEVLWAGNASKSKAAEALPMLNAVVSYPTMIFVGKDGKVKRIHTGFNGPATSEHEQFTKDFDTFVRELTSR